MQAATPPDLTPSLWYHLGCTRARLQNWAGAASAYERAAACLPTHPGICHELAKAYQVRLLFNPICVRTAKSSNAGVMQQQCVQGVAAASPCCSD
jgi:hypothetical protein